MELKPCPFCGCLAWMHAHQFDDGKAAYRVECEGRCGAMTTNWHTEPEAVAHWNMRADQPDAIPCPHPDIAIIDGVCYCCGKPVASTPTPQPDAAIPCSSCGQPAAAHAVQNGGYVCPPNQPAATLECAHDGRCTFWETATMSGILCHVCGKNFDVHTYSAADQPAAVRDPEAVEIVRCPRCHALPRPSLMGGCVCPNCGTTVLQPVPESAADNSPAAHEPTP